MIISSSFDVFVLNNIPPICIKLNSELYWKHDIELILSENIKGFLLLLVICNSYDDDVSVIWNTNISYFEVKRTTLKHCLPAIYYIYYYIIIYDKLYNSFQFQLLYLELF